MAIFKGKKKRVTQHVKKYGLVGYPLTHSFSKRYFDDKFVREKIAGYVYELFPLSSIKQFPGLIEDDKTIIGLNVTIPHKEKIMAYLDELDDTARTIGAVNCLKKEDGKWKGYNTDYTGFKTSLLQLIEDPGKVEQAFVLGTGGASKAVCYALQNLNIAFAKVSRDSGDDSIGYMDIVSHMKGANLFINATPVGMYPATGSAPAIPYERITGKDFLYDLVYNPAETWFLNKGKAKGAKTMNGLKMLEIQAEESWKIWNPEGEI